MKPLELLIPYSLPPKDVAKDLQAQLKAPHFATLLGLTRVHQVFDQAEYTRAHVHEYFVCGDLKSELAGNKPETETLSRRSSPAMAHKFMRDYGILPTTGFWFLVRPVHLHVALDHLVLTESADLALSDDEAKKLFALAKSICDEFSRELLFGDANHWFLRADDWQALTTSSLNAACGHNIDIWMAEGEHAREWRKIQNEIQMLWFSSELHQQRQELGLPEINSLWLSHGSATLNPSIKSCQSYHPSTTTVAAMTAATNSLWLCNQLESAWLNADWYSWLNHFELLDQHLFGELQLALNSGQISALKLHLSRANFLSSHQIQAKSWWNFLRKPDLNVLTRF